MLIKLDFTVDEFGVKNIYPLLHLNNFFLQGLLSSNEGFSATVFLETRDYFFKLVYEHDFFDFSISSFSLNDNGKSVSYRYSSSDESSFGRLFSSLFNSFKECLK